MASLTQDDRPIALETSLGKDKLILTSFSGEERMSQLFSFSLEMISEDGGIKPDAIVGSNVSFNVRHEDGEPRWFNGIVNGFGYSGEDDRIHHYKAHVVPTLWLLTRGSDFRVHECHEQKSAVEIIDGVFGELGLSDYEWKLKRQPLKRKYCVQYRETHFDFVVRLLQEEGIGYYFKHEQGAHTLVLTDHTQGFYDAKDSQVSLASNLSQPEVTDNLTAWSHEYEYVAGKATMTDYDFENPDTSLLNQTSGLVSVKDNSKYEFYEYPGEYAVKGDGEPLAKLRMEEEEAAYETVTGGSTCRSFSPGARFTVQHHHNSAEEGRKWLLTAVEHFASVGGGYFSSRTSSDEIYRNSFRGMPADVVFRPPRTHRKPRVMGMLSALVVGPSGEEIHTDEYGRIRVQFHWDRKGAKDDKACCMVRVATPWAGAQWGMIHIPRIGHEVIVAFEDGDPDRPFVMGSLYNGNNMPPYSLPDNKTQSGIKSRSSQNGSDENFNEIRFEDKKDSEEIYVHAEKDFNCVIENNETRKVGHDKTDSGDQEIDIYNDQNLIVGQGSGSGSQTVDIEQDRTVTLAKGNDSLTIKQGNMSVVLKQGNQETTLDMGNQSTKLKMGNQETKLDLGKASTEAMQSIELKVGQSSIKVDQMGVTIKGMMVKVEGQIMTEVKGLMTKVNGDAMLQAKGGITMIN